jgi:hypothetical protein
MLISKKIIKTYDKTLQKSFKTLSVIGGGKDYSYFDQDILFLAYLLGVLINKTMLHALAGLGVALET